MNTVKLLRRRIAEYYSTKQPHRVWPHPGPDITVSIEDLEALCDIAEAAREIKTISSGYGPAAPVFDRYDYMVERNRGKWYKVDGKQFDALKQALKKVE